MAKIFFIGATGHIGAAVVDKIQQKYPKAELTALFRSDEKAERFIARFPGIKPVIGDHTSLDIIEQYSREASIVINAAPDVYPDVTDAIASGLGTRFEKGFYIHTAGAALIWGVSGGEPDPRVWDDMADIEEIKNRPDGTIHRDTDAKVRSYVDVMNIAIIAPAGVYGVSPSPEHPTYLMLPDLISNLRKVNSGFVIGRGANLQSWVHVIDLSTMYMALLDDALKGHGQANPLLWGVDAYYFAGDEELPFREYVEPVLPLALKYGIIQQDSVKSIPATVPKEDLGERRDLELHEWSNAIAMLFGVNMRCRNVRATKMLGYQPKEKSFAESLPETMDIFMKSGRH